MGKIVSKNELATLAEELLNKLESKVDSATILFLEGNLGAGKTTLTQLLAKELEVEEVVVSPTYVILKKYLLPNGKKWQSLIHLDLYRLDNLRDAEILGLAEMASDPKNLLVIEWPKQIANLNIKPTVTIKLEPHSEEERLIDIIYHD